MSSWPSPSASAAASSSLLQPYGAFGDDVLSGGAGNNVLHGDGGNDVLIGTGGFAVAAYSGSYADYAIIRNIDGSYTTRRFLTRDATKVDPEIAPARLRARTLAA